MDRIHVVPCHDAVDGSDAADSEVVEADDGNSQEEEEGGTSDDDYIWKGSDVPTMNDDNASHVVVDRHSLAVRNYTVVLVVVDILHDDDGGGDDVAVHVLLVVVDEDMTHVKAAMAVLDGDDGYYYMYH